MINIKKNLTEPHKANTIDKRAIHNLIPYLQWEVERDGLNVTFDGIFLLKHSSFASLLFVLAEIFSFLYICDFTLLFICL